MAFTSASSVRSFFEILGSKGFSNDKILEGLYGMSVIGAQADEECKKMHVKETCVSNVHTIEGLASMITGKIEIKKVKNCDDACRHMFSIYSQINTIFESEFH